MLIRVARVVGTICWIGALALLIPNGLYSLVIVVALLLFAPRWIREGPMGGYLMLASYPVALAIVALSSAVVIVLSREHRKALRIVAFMDGLILAGAVIIAILTYTLFA